MVPSLIYLNNAATSWPKPPNVVDAVNASLETPFSEVGRSTTGISSDCVADARESVARYFHAPERDHMIFSANATDALNTLIHGFTKKQTEPFHVVITELEHNSVIRPLKSLESERKCHVTVAHCNGNRIDPSTIENSLQKDTQLVVMAHGSNVLGSVQDISAIGTLLQEKGIFFIVDGAQTAGLTPINLKRLPLDAFVFTGHKYLFGLPGTGGFYISDPTKISSTRQGGTGTDSRSVLHPETMPEMFETGTHNYPGLISLTAGIEYLEKIGFDTISSKIQKQNQLFLEEFDETDKIIVYTTAPELPIISFNMRNIGNDDAGFILRNMYGIVTRTGLHCAPLIHERIDGGQGCVRISPSILTSDEDCQQAAKIIREVASDNT